jgi:hypothetical protein
MLRDMITSFVGALMSAEVDPVRRGLWRARLGTGEPPATATGSALGTRMGARSAWASRKRCATSSSAPPPSPDGCDAWGRRPLDRPGSSICTLAAALPWRRALPACQFGQRGAQRSPLAPSARGSVECHRRGGSARGQLRCPPHRRRPPLEPAEAADPSLSARSRRGLTLLAGCNLYPMPHKG